MNTSLQRLMIVGAFISLFFPIPVQAVDIAPRITDREIIEGLSELKTRSKHLESTMNARFQSMETTMNARFKAMETTMDERFKAVNQRFNAVDQRFNAVDQRFNAVDQRFESMEEQFGRIWSLMLVNIAGIFGLIGFVVWDRRTVLKPVEQRLDRMESYLEHDLEIKHEDGSRMTRLVKVLREMAREDERLTTVLRSFSLM